MYTTNSRVLNAFKKPCTNRVTTFGPVGARPMRAHIIFTNRYSDKKTAFYVFIRAA